MYSTLETKHMDAYNKHPHTQHGTLMGNWWEEDELRINNNGITRTTLMTHMKKTHEQLFPDKKLDKIDI